MINKIV